MLGYLSADNICFEKRTVFLERSSRKTVATVSFEEQIMSKDKYPNIFSPQMETIVFIILEIFYATRAALKTGVYITRKAILIIMHNRRDGSDGVDRSHLFNMQPLFAKSGLIPMIRFLSQICIRINKQ